MTMPLQVSADDQRRDDQSLETRFRVHKVRLLHAEPRPGGRRLAAQRFRELGRSFGIRKTGLHLLQVAGNSWNRISVYRSDQSGRKLAKRGWIFK